MQSDESGVLLTTADVLKWKADRDDLVQQIAALQEKLGVIDRRLSILDAILSPSARAALLGEAYSDPPKPKNDLHVWLRERLRSAGTPLTLREIIEELKNSEFAERISRNPNSVYNAVSRMADRGEIKRAGKAIVSSEVFDRLIAAGQDPFVGQEEPETAPDIIQKILRDSPTPMTTAEIMQIIRSDSTLGPKLARNPQYGYTVLGRMLKRGQIGRDGNAYFALGGDESGAEKK
jgi:hypothetical protein